MSKPPPLTDVKCHECGAENARSATECWLCRAPLAPATMPSNYVGPVAPPTAWPTAPRERPTRQPSSKQFQLSSLLLTITVVCLCLGLARRAPGMIVPLLIISVPALIRTMIVSNRASAKGTPMGVGAKIQSFIVSVLVVILVIVGACVALCAACFAIVFSAMR